MGRSSTTTAKSSIQIMYFYPSPFTLSLSVERLNAKRPSIQWHSQPQPCNKTSPQHPIMTAIWPRDVAAANTHVPHSIPFPLARNVRLPLSPYLVSSPVLPSGRVDLELALVGRSLGPEMSSGSCLISRARGEVTGVRDMYLAVNELIKSNVYPGFICNIVITVSLFYIVGFCYVG